MQTLLRQQVQDISAGSRGPFGLASLLLMCCALVFLSTFVMPDTTITQLLRAMSEAGLIGGLADWFAVTALFRHPLNIPIPHTALLRRRKAEAADGLARFVTTYVLVPEKIEGTVSQAQITHLIGGWLQKRENAEKVAKVLSRSALRALRRLPGHLQDRVLPDLLKKSDDTDRPSGYQALLHQAKSLAGHNREIARKVLNAGSQSVLKRPVNEALAKTLTADPALITEFQEKQSSDAIARLLSALGGHLQTQDRAAHELDDLIAGIVAGLTETNRVALGQFISDALQSWDTDALVDGIEQEVGRDLQFVRINGTVLGAFLGGCFFAVEALLG